MAPASSELVDAVPDVDASAVHLVARAGVDDVRVRWRDLHRPDRRDFPDRVEHGIPRHPGAGGLPHTAGGSAGVVHAGFADRAGDRADAAAAERADVAPDEAGEEVGLDGRRGAEREKRNHGKGGARARRRGSERHGNRVVSLSQQGSVRRRPFARLRVSLNSAVPALPRATCPPRVAATNFRRRLPRVLAGCLASRPAPRIARRRASSETGRERVVGAATRGHPCGPVAKVLLFPGRTTFNSVVRSGASWPHPSSSLASRCSAPCC